MSITRWACGTPPSAGPASSLPQAIQRRSFTREQLLLAQAKTGDNGRAIAGLEELIRLSGETPERCGLIGGRYKRLWREARDARPEESPPTLQEQGYLDEAIRHYQLGTQLDFNAYYCPSNLPGLLRERGRPGDAEEADFLDEHTVRTCRRAIDRGEDDGWAKPTLLVAAYRTGDVERIKELTVEVARQGAADWQLASAMDDISDVVQATADAALREQLLQERDRLAELLPNSP
jgi:hypothetical protein